MSLRREAIFLLENYGVKPKKRLGQSFMVSKATLQSMVNHADVTGEDIVLDIGAGLGFLTRVLAERAGRVIAVEVDRKLVKALRDKCGGYKNVTVVEGDILRVQLPSFNKIVSNPPYAISSPLLMKLVKEGFECAVLTLQEEFVRKLVARPGTPDYGRLTVMVYHRWGVQPIRKVAKTRFYPTPKVDSYLVRLDSRKTPLVRLRDEALFHRLVTSLFSQRRKGVRRALQTYLRKQGRLDAVEPCLRVLPDPNLRVYQLSPEAFGGLANTLYRELKHA